MLRPFTGPCVRSLSTRAIVKNLTREGFGSFAASPQVGRMTPVYYSGYRIERIAFCLCNLAAWRTRTTVQRLRREG